MEKKKYSKQLLYHILDILNSHWLSQALINDNVS